MIKTLGFIGAGNFGVFIVECISREASWIKALAWDKYRPCPDSLEATLACDAVVFAVPPKAYIPTLRTLVPRMRLDATIVDVCTVKVRTVEVLAEVADGRPWIACHPMFGRQSFVDQGESLARLQIVICKMGNMPAQTQLQFERFLTEQVRLDVVHMTPDEHDRLQASEQLLVQYIGASVNEAGFGLNGHAHTVSAKHFFRAMQIVGNDAELFRQAAALNPYWPEVLARYELAQAKHKLAMLSE